MVGAGEDVGLFVLTVDSEAPLLFLDPRRRRRRRSRRSRRGNDTSVSADPLPLLLREALALPPEGAGEGPELERRALPDETEDEAEEMIVGSEGKPFDPPPFPPLPVDGRSVGSKAGSAVPSAKATAGARKSNAKERFMVVVDGW